MSGRLGSALLSPATTSPPPPTSPQRFKLERNSDLESWTESKIIDLDPNASRTSPMTPEEFKAKLASLSPSPPPSPAYTPSLSAASTLRGTSPYSPYSPYSPLRAPRYTPVSATPSHSPSYDTATSKSVVEMDIDERGSFLDHAATFHNHVDASQALLTPSPDKAVHVDVKANALARVRSDLVQKRVESDMRALEDSIKAVAISRSPLRQIEETENEFEENEYEITLRKLQEEKRQRQDREKRLREAEEREIQRRVGEASEVAQKARAFAQAALEAQRKEREEMERKEEEERMRREMDEKARLEREERARKEREDAAKAAQEEAARRESAAQQAAPSPQQASTATSAPPSSSASSFAFSSSSASASSSGQPAPPSGSVRPSSSQAPSQGQRAVREAEGTLFALQEWRDTKNFFRALQENTRSMEQRNQERQGIKKALISAFNTLAAIGKQVEDKVGQVIRVLDQTANDPVLSLFAMNEIGLNIARQAQMQIARRPETAFPYMMVIEHVARRYDHVADVVIKNLINVCPYAIPVYPERRPGQTLKEYKLNTLKYRERLDDDGVESDEAYTMRMCGVIYAVSALYGMQTGVENNRPVRSRIRHAWTWLARILNMPPRSITAHLLLAFLENTAVYLFNTYGKQFEKLLFVIEQYAQNLPADSTAPKTRMLLFLENCKNNRVGPPKGSQIDYQ